MPFIDVNFSDVPDSFEPLKPGVYNFLIEDIVIEPTKNGKGQKAVVSLKVSDEDNDAYGRVVKDHISLDYPTSLKQLIMSAGFEPTAEGIDTEQLIGHTVRGLMKSRTFKDKDTGEIKETCSIDSFIWK